MCVNIHALALFLPFLLAPELLPKLFPVQSPMMCAAIYAQKEMGVSDKLAFISPCIAKKAELEAVYIDMDKTTAESRKSEKRQENCLRLSMRSMAEPRHLPLQQRRWRLHPTVLWRLQTMCVRCWKC